MWTRKRHKSFPAHRAYQTVSPNLLRRGLEAGRRFEPRKKPPCGEPVEQPQGCVFSSTPKALGTKALGVQVKTGEKLNKTSAYSAVKQSL
jgi:hypothetical protein